MSERSRMERYQEEIDGDKARRDFYDSEEELDSQAEAKASVPPPVPAEGEAMEGIAREERAERAAALNTWEEVAAYWKAQWDEDVARFEALRSQLAERDEEIARLREFEDTDHTEKDLVSIAALSHENVSLRAANAALEEENARQEDIIKRLGAQKLADELARASTVAALGERLEKVQGLVREYLPNPKDDHVMFFALVKCPEKEPQDRCWNCRARAALGAEEKSDGK